MSVFSDLIESKSELYAACCQAAARRCRRLVHDESEIEGIVQDAWERALRCGDSLREPDTAIGWFASIAVRLCIDRGKKRRASAKLEAEYAQWSQEFPRGGATDTPILRQEFLDDVETLVMKLPPDDRKLVILRDSGRRSWAEVGNMMGKTPAAARKQGKRAQALLRDRIIALNDDYAMRDEPELQSSPPLRRTTREDMCRYIAQLKVKGAKLSPEERKELFLGLP